MKPWMFALALGLSTLSSAHADDALKQAIAGKQRSAANAARDVARHPYETLSFFGIKPNMTVVELAPGGGWYTEILAPYLKDQGKLIAGAPDPQSKSDYSKRSLARYQQKLAEQADVYGKVELGIFEPGQKIDYAKPASVDMVLTFRNVHNWIGTGETSMKQVFSSAFSALKPGGVLGVVEHRLPVAKNQDEKASSGYVHESYVIKLAQDAGFKLAAKSEVNANPKDSADHENGVWALAPTYANKDKDRAKYQAIGESDRMTLKFVKP